MFENLLNLALRKTIQVVADGVINSVTAHVQFERQNSPDSDGFSDETVRSVESNGFWLLTSLFPSGACLQYEYWINDWKHTGTLIVDDEPKRFVETEPNPTKIRVRILSQDE